MTDGPSAARELDAWLAAGDAKRLVEHYPLLQTAAAKKRVIEWAVSVAPGGQVRPLLEIAGIEDNAALMRTLVETLDAAGPDGLVRYLHIHAMPNPHKRGAALILGRCAPGPADELFAELLDDTNSLVRESAVRAMWGRAIEAETLIAVFAARLHSDKHAGVRLAAARGLLHVGTPMALATFQASLKDNPATREIEAVLRELRGKISGAPAPASYDASADALPPTGPAAPATPRLPARQLAGFAVGLAVVLAGGYMLYRALTRSSELAAPLPGERSVFNRSK